MQPYSGTRHVHHHLSNFTQICQFLFNEYLIVVQNPNYSISKDHVWSFFRQMFLSHESTRGFWMSSGKATAISRYLKQFILQRLDHSVYEAIAQAATEPNPKTRGRPRTRNQTEPRIIMPTTFCYVQWKVDMPSFSISESAKEKYKALAGADAILLKLTIAQIQDEKMVAIAKNDVIQFNVKQLNQGHKHVKNSLPEPDQLPDNADIATTKKQKTDNITVPDNINASHTLSLTKNGPNFKMIEEQHGLTLSFPCLSMMVVPGSITIQQLADGSVYISGSSLYLNVEDEKWCFHIIAQSGKVLMCPPSVSNLDTTTCFSFLFLPTSSWQLHGDFETIYPKERDF